MPIVKNEPVYDPEKDYPGGCYIKPRHVIVEGTHEEMAYELSKMAQRDYGVKSLWKYTNSTYGEAHKVYMERNFPLMAKMSKGVRKAFGLDENDAEYDATQVPYDWSPITPEMQRKQEEAMKIEFCSFFHPPVEKSDDGSVITSRNLDMFTINLYKGLMGVPLNEDDYGYMSRALVMEKRPTDDGYKTICVGGMEALYPYTDGMNEKGLYFTVLSDPFASGKGGSPIAGGAMNGVSASTLGPLLLETCATVKEAKQVILLNRIVFRFVTCHIVLVDATGDGCVFEIDAKTQEYMFTDRKPNGPLFCTNHPLHTYPGSSSFPEYKTTEGMNTFLRMDKMQGIYDSKNKEGKSFTKEDAMEMTDSCHCSYVDTAMAGCRPSERTIWNVTANLTKKEFYVSFYVRDVEPVPGTNIMKDIMTKRYTFGF